MDIVTKYMLNHFMLLLMLNRNVYTMSFKSLNVQYYYGRKNSCDEIAKKKKNFMCNNKST